MKEYQQEFERFIGQHVLLESLRQYILKMIARLTQRAKEIKTHFANQNTTVASEQIKTILTEPYLKDYINSPHFPVKGTDEETVQLKQELMSVFTTLCDIELTHVEK